MSYTFALKEVDTFGGTFLVPATADPTNTQYRLLKGDALPTSDAKGPRSGQDVTRRPMRGIQPKKDTYATIAVVDYGQRFYSTRNSSSPDPTGNNGPNPPVSVPGVGWGDFNANFLIQSVSEERSEKFQAMTTFGTTHGFFFGEQARFKTYRAILMNTEDFQWEVEWWHNYEEYLRGTRLTDRKARAYLTYDDVIVEGYLIQAQTSKDAGAPGSVQLTFTMWVTREEFLVTPGANMPAWNIVVPPTTTLDATTALGVLPSADVRLRNLAAYQAGQGFSLTSFLRSTLAVLEDPLGALFDQIDLQNLKNFLYGRNIRVPAGFLGGDTGPATIVAGTGGEALGGLVTVRVPAVVPLYYKTVAKTFYEGNGDEYPAREGSLQNPTASAALGALPLPDVYNPEVAALQAFAEFGVVDPATQNLTGVGPSDALRLLGRTVYGALSIAAAFAITEADAAQQEAELDARRKLLVGSV